MRLIDADAFKKVLSEKEMQHDKRRSFDDYHCGAANAYEHANDLLDEMPTIERPHGEWVFKNDNPLISTGYWECSKCKKGRLMVEENFCPNCGADMRKEGDSDA